MKHLLLPFEPVGADDTREISGRDHHYLVHVRRSSAGTIIPAIAPSGRRYSMDILAVGRDNMTVRLRPEHEVAADIDGFTVRIVLIPAVTRGSKLDLTIRQAVETGVSEIWPILTEHSQVRFSGSTENSQRMSRWSRIAIEALQQCGGSQPVHLEPPTALKDALDRWNRRGLLLFFHERAIPGRPAKTLHRYLAEPVQELAIIVGPEGGLSTAEIRFLEDSGGQPVHLGSRVLRAETAALYALAAVNTILREKAEWQAV